MRAKRAEEMMGQLTAAAKARLAHYTSNLDSPNDRIIFDDGLDDYFQSIAWDSRSVIELKRQLDTIKWGQSIYNPVSMYVQVDRFTTPDKPDKAYRRYFESAFQLMKHEVKSARLKMLTYNTDGDIVNALPRLDTHAGFSFIQTGLKYKGDYTEEILASYTAERKRAMKERSFNKPILLGRRTQGKVPYDLHTGDFSFEEHKGIDAYYKTRLVSMVDIYQIIGEMEFAKPFQNYLSMQRWYAGGSNDGQLAKDVASDRLRYSSWLSVDYSSYDQTIPAWLIRKAFDIVREAFNPDFFDNDFFEVIREDFINKVFVAGDKLVESHKGVPSGSMFTQIIDSIANRLMITAYFIQQGYKPEDFDMIIMGDDNLIFYTTKNYTNDIDLDDMSRFLSREYGVSMNPSKVDRGNSFKHDPVFLSRVWDRFGAYRPPQIITAKALYPERFRDYRKGGFTPAMVAESFFASFRRGMDEWYDYKKHAENVQNEKIAMTDGKWMTGLHRYRELYLGKGLDILYRKG